MWNFPGNQQGGYPPPPSGPPSGGSPPYGQPQMGFPSPGFPSAQPAGGTRGYNPGYSPSYTSPGIPSAGGYGSYGPPPGPPPSVPPQSNASTYPNPHHHHHPPHFSPPSGPPPGGYPRPSGPPSGGYNPPSQPPPVPARSDRYQSGAQGSYAPPPGPPPRPPTQQQHYGPSFEGANHQPQQPFFQYSQCTGKKKALCIGVNYVGQQAELKGCINDARNVQRFLCTYYGYKSEDIVMLTDDARDPRQVPTKQNMLRAMEWLVRGAQPNDSLFFHYSGHGGQTKDTDGDEADGFDEVIYPVDFKQAGHIVDDTMHQIMVKPLPAGCRLTAIFDSCHSGSALDLPYIYSTEGKIKEPNLAAEAGQGLLSAVSSYARGDLGGVFSSMTGIIKTATGSNQRAEKVARATRTSPADVISWSGCKDSQTSADTFEAGQSTGAMSYAFISALSQNRQQSYQQLLNTLRDILRNKYSQKPQLSSSHPMDTNLLFIC